MAELIHSNPRLLLRPLLNDGKKLISGFDEESYQDFIASRRGCRLTSVESPLEKKYGQEALFGVGIEVNPVGNYLWLFG